MKPILLLAAFIAISSGVRAQTAEDSVKAVIQNLFTAMKSNDSMQIMSSFSDSAILQTIVTNRKGEVKIMSEQVAAFAKSVKSAPAGSLDERIRFDVVKTDGVLAIAWTPYEFYFNGKFSHCGVNSFQLVRVNNTWKIQYLIDTRKKTGCTGN